MAFDYNFAYRSAIAFGEWAWSNKTIAGISGMLLTPSRHVSLIAALRYYPHSFLSLHGLGFGDRTSTSNENGLYLGIRLKPFQRVTIVSYYDQFKFPEPTSSVSFPSKGNDFLAEVKFIPKARLELTARYQRRLTEVEEVITNDYGFDVRVNDSQQRQNYRLNVEYQLTKNLRLRGRFERVYFTTKFSQRNEKGLLLYQDIKFNPTEAFRCNLRLLFFQTDSYDARIYEYENDLRGVFTLPPLYGRGVRWYLLVRYKLADQIELSAKYSDLIRDDVKRIGSGLDELPTNHDNRIGVQIDFRI